MTNSTLSHFKSAPLGLKIIAIFFFAVTVDFIIESPSAVGMVALITTWGAPGVFPLFAFLGLLFVIGEAVLFFIVGRGLLHHKKWARILGLVLTGFYILVSSGGFSLVSTQFTPDTIPWMFVIVRSVEWCVYIAVFAYMLLSQSFKKATNQ